MTVATAKMLIMRMVTVDNVDFASSFIVPLANSVLFSTKQNFKIKFWLEKERLVMGTNL